MRSIRFICTELDSHPRYPLALCADRRYPDDPALNPNRPARIEQPDRHRDVVAQFAGTVGANEYPAVTDEGHVCPA